MCQDRSPIRGGDEKGLEYNRTQEASGTCTVYSKTDLDLVSPHIVNALTSKHAMRIRKSTKNKIIVLM